jgi:hypothetical protein
MTSTANRTAFNFELYQEDVATGGTLPHFQLITAKEKDRPFGFFIPHSKAAQVDFVIGDAWELSSQYFTKNGKEVETPGLITKRSLIPGQTREYLSDWIKVVVVRDTPILFYAPNSRGDSVALGNFYTSSGEPNPEYEALLSKDNHYRATKNLVYFLDANNEPLQERPLQFKAKTAFGASFGVELRQLRQEMTTAFFGAATAAGVKMPGNQLAPAFLACSVFSFKIGLKSNTLSTGAVGAMSCYVAQRMIPTCDPAKVGTSEIVNRKTGSGLTPVEVHYVDWQDLLISKSCDFGQQVLIDWEKYKDWGSVNGNDSTASGDRNKGLTEDQRAALMQESAQLIKQLGWNEDYARNYLLSNYSKRGRQLLTDEEFVDFVKRLKSRLLGVAEPLQEAEVYYDDDEFPNPPY